MVPTLYRDKVWSKPDRVNQCFGIYQTYAEARNAITENHAKGWDNEQIIACEHFQPSIFATMFWMARIVKPGMHVVDFGGAVGQTRRAIKQRMSLPDDVHWHVVDVPSAVKRGRELAAARGESGIAFSERLDDVKACDVFLSRGCLQYVEDPLETLLARFDKLPRYLLIDKLPLVDGPGFCTVQNLAVSAAPYRIFNRQEFLAPLVERGYVVRDEWAVEELKCAIAFHPQKFLPSHTGILLERSA